MKNLGPISSYFVLRSQNFPSSASTTCNFNSMDSSYQSSNFNNMFTKAVCVNFIPSEGDIEPNCRSCFDIVVSSKIYGIYEDIVTIDVDYLPELKFRILIINEDFPLVYPICKNTVNVIPKIK